MKLVYQFNTPHTDTIDRLCKTSNDLYNQSLYEWKQLHESEENTYLSYFQLNAHMKTVTNLEGQKNYYLMASHSAQYVIKTVHDNISSFFKAIKQWKSAPAKFLAKPEFPRYRKRGSLFTLFFTNQTCIIRDGFIVSKKWKVTIPIPNFSQWSERLSSFKQVRIIPKRKSCRVEIFYNYTPQQADVDKTNVASIDFGIDNLVTMVTSDGCKIWSGKYLKSYNHHFNKEKARLSSIHNLQGHKGITNRIRIMFEKRDAYFKQAYHCISRQIINTLISNHIGTLVVGYNKGWKQEVNIGKANNQKFLSISHARLKEMLEYKCKMVGIVFVVKEEAYTSKCDALAFEEIGKHEQYLGKRIRRGLFKSSVGKLINADQNGALNIMRKVVGDSHVREIIDRGHCLCPVKNPCPFG